MRDSAAQTRRRLLAAGLRLFARRGYAGTSVRDIVAAAGLTKPSLYYHFGSKAGLYKALVDSAQDERLRLMQAAVARGRTTAERLEEILAAVFEFSRRNADLMRLAFATVFAARDKAPDPAEYLAKGRRNFEFIRRLVEAGQRTGELRRDVDSESLAFSIYGQLISYIMVHLLVPQSLLDRSTARLVVRLFLEGAATRLPACGDVAPAPNE